MLKNSQGTVDKPSTDDVYRKVWPTSYHLTDPTEEQVMQSGIRPESIGIISPYGAQAGRKMDIF